MGLFKNLFRKLKNNERVRGSNDENQFPDDLKDLFQVISFGHMLLIRDGWPIALTNETTGVIPLLKSFVKADNSIIREEIKKYISTNNIIRDDNPIFYARVLAERQVFSDYLLNLFSAVKNYNKNMEEIGLLLNNVFASMLKLSPAEYIDLFSDYFLKSKQFDQINDRVYEQCLNTMLMVTFATGNEKLGERILNKRNEKHFSKVEKNNITSHFQYAERRFGALNEKWIFKYIN
jgi:hypothetical protein